jgi:hypothetical protein
MPPMVGQEGTAREDGEEGVWLQAVPAGDMRSAWRLKRSMQENQAIDARERR